jgi:hypothetical protein
MTFSMRKMYMAGIWSCAFASCIPKMNVWIQEGAVIYILSSTCPIMYRVEEQRLICTSRGYRFLTGQCSCNVILSYLHFYASTATIFTMKYNSRFYNTIINLIRLVDVKISL